MDAFSLPDVSRDPLSIKLPLDWVGMENIALPLSFAQQRSVTKANAFVSLDDAQAKGIHMSRLYTRLLELSAKHTVTPSDLKDVLQDFLHSHEGLSTRAKIEFSGELTFERPALISALSGWKSYPFQLTAMLIEQNFQLNLSLEVAYSSTCPCSAALSRDLIQKRFHDAIAIGELDPSSVTQLASWLGTTQAIVATPHSQRSFAQLNFQLVPTINNFDFLGLIDLAEITLGTAVQTAVKRADEQAFALANGQNLMFCEDAARKLSHAFIGHPALSGFHIKVIHAESLHAHDAVAQSCWQKLN